MAPKLRVAGAGNRSFRPGIGRSAFGVEEGQKAVASATEKIGVVMEDMAIERNENEGTLAGIEAQKNSSIALFQAQQNDPVNYAENAKKILEETRLNSTKGLQSTHAEKAFNNRWNSFAASRMVNAYQVQEVAQKDQNLAVWDESMNQELSNMVANPQDLPSKSRQEEYLEDKMRISGIQKGDPRYDIARSQMTEQFYAAQIAGYSNNGDNDKAKELLNNEQGKALDPDVREKLTAEIRSKETEILTNVTRATGQVLFDDPEALAAERERIRKLDLKPNEQQALVNALNGGANEQKANDNAIYTKQASSLVNEYLQTGNTQTLKNLRTEKEKIAAISLYNSSQKARGGANSDDSQVAVLGKSKVLRSIKDSDFNDLGQDEDGNNITAPVLAMQLIVDEQARIQKVVPGFTFSAKSIASMLKEAEDKADGKDSRKSDAIAKEFYKDFFSIATADFSAKNPSWAVWAETANKEDWAGMGSQSERIEAATQLSKTMKSQVVTDFGLFIDSDTTLKNVLDDGTKIDFDEDDRDEDLIGGQNVTRDSIDAQIKAIDANQPITDRLRAFFLLKNMNVPRKSIELYLNAAYGDE